MYSKTPAVHDMQQSQIWAKQLLWLCMHGVMACTAQCMVWWRAQHSAWCDGVHRVVGMLIAKATWSMMAHTCNPSNLEAEAGGSLGVPSQPGLHGIWFVINFWLLHIRKLFTIARLFPAAEFSYIIPSSVVSPRLQSYGLDIFRSAVSSLLPMWGPLWYLCY